MAARYRQKKSIALVFLIALLLIAAGGAVYFYLDRETTSGEIAAIDTADYAEYAAEKTVRHKAQGLPISQEIKEVLEDKTYQTPLGFSIISYSDKWRGEKLKEIYKELLNNTHGDEMMYVGEVTVYPGSSEQNTEDTTIAGTQATRHDYYPVFFDMPSLVPGSLKYTIRPKVSVIQLFNMDKYDDAAEAARTIAHEYGHHYTKYYFLKDEEAAKESEYFDLRALGDVDHEVIYTNWDEYLKNHEWDIFEMAAEDYVQLMGSPNAKKTRNYKDRYDLLRAGVKDYDPVIDDRTVNVFPQENIYIPLADEIDGLRDYYYSFLDMENEFPPLEKVDFKIKVSKHISNGFKYYNVTWKKPTKDKDALYTLVCYDKKGVPFWPVRTVKGNQEAIAKVGTPSIENGIRIYYWPDSIPDEDRIFKLYLLLPDGRMQASEPYYANF